MRRRDGTSDTDVTARVEEQYDQAGDLVWVLTVAAATHDRRQLDRIAEALGCELRFVPVPKGAA